MKYLPWVLLIALALVGYQYHARSTGRLEGEIKARGESIKQLGQIAGARQRAYQKAKVAYVKEPTLEKCSVVLLTCEERHETDSTRIVALEKQTHDLKKLSNRDKLFGFLPRPTVQVGYCLTADGKMGPCISGGFPILK